jgi:light-regulated signal transduction histidine kinase (bacteriophytochrome)
MHPLDFYDDDLKEVVKERMASTFVKPAHGVELLLLTKSKIKIPFYYNSLSLNYEGVPCIMGMAIDVSDRKIIENALQVSNKNLEQKATELRESNAELERFAYIVSHDLQEPLRMVSSFMKLLEQKYKGQLDEKGEKYINFAVDGADRMKQLIMDLLEYSRTGTNRDVPIETDMNDVMKEVMSVLRNSIIENNAIVEVGQLPVLPKARRLQMFQLMQNLLGNALKYHSDKKPLIKIDAKCEAHQWLFSVQDNGIGIDPAYHEKIFVIFQRLHGRNEFSGTGIGLAICKKIVDKLGGKIWVESEPGVGSTFYFTVPRS